MRDAMSKKVTMFIGSEKIGCYVNGNHRTVLFADGTKIKQTGHWVDFDEEGTRKWEDDDQDHFTYDFPENFDIKITDYCDGGCAYCFPEGTPVRLSNGNTIPIQQIAVGNAVLTYDVHTQTSLTGIVSAVFAREYDGDLIGIELDGTVTWCTPTHKIMTSNRGLINAEHVTLEDDIVTL